jgi:hypothetical protein
MPDNDRIAGGHADITKAEKIDKGKIGMTKGE